jgi:chromosome segregation ATPase
LPKLSAVCALALGLCAAGCSPYGPEELDRLTKEDPAFKQMIVARDQMRGQIHAIKQDLLQKKSELDGQVDRLRRDYDVYAKAQHEKIEKYHSVLDASRNLLERDTDTAVAQLDAKQAELDRLKKTLEEVVKVLRQSKDITLSAQEKAKWEERRLMISEKMRPLSEEIQELQARIRLNKRKIGFLK